MKKILTLIMLLGSINVYAQIVVETDTITVGNTSGAGGVSLFGKAYLKNVPFGTSHDSVLVRNANGSIRMVPRSSFGTSGAGAYLPLAAGSSNPLTGKLFFSGNNTEIMGSNSATTGYQYAQFMSSGANMFWGINNSAGTFLPGGAAYSGFLTTGNTTALDLGTNNTVRYSISGAGNHDFKSGTATFGGDIGIGSTPASGGSNAKWLTFDGTTSAYGGGIIYKAANTIMGYQYFGDGYLKYQTTPEASGHRFMTNNGSQTPFEITATQITATTPISGTSATFSSAGSFAGTIHANSPGGNVRLKSDGSDTNDGFIGTSGGNLYFRNWAGTRGVVIDGSGNANFTHGITAVNNISTSADLAFLSNSGFGLLSQNGTRVLALTNNGVNIPVLTNDLTVITGSTSMLSLVSPGYWSWRVQGTTDRMNFMRDGTVVGYAHQDGNLYWNSGVYTASHGNSSQWNTAYGWGNHASAGYLTSGSLSSYLALTGGTLSGTLGGTSASFSGNITAGGDITANSDARLKKDIRPLDDVTAQLRSLNAVSYRMKADNSLHIGLVAQEVEKQFPLLVRKADDTQGTLSVNYQALTAPLLKGWQEHDTLIQQQAEKIKTQEDRIARLEKELIELKNLVKQAIK